ncbi:hypothetical protein DPMN_147439 [Dreissena polymorpha]|uniref:Uncharacterized protein n=1 Tax=Dreissena polymorpha TaxID=45954 RepID=A0A9D4F7S1_DREPO|nr:hypothetical protein DPMN_147439 [Dreissena polymorpha]
MFMRRASPLPIGLPMALLVLTSGKDQKVTIIGCGSGMQIPPFFIFQGKRMNPDLLHGASA